MNSEPLSPQANALLVRLQYAKSLQFNDVLKEILDQGEALDQAIQIVEHRIDEGFYVINEYAAEFISRTKSSDLYTKIREQLLRNDQTILSLYKARYPDIEIEERLCRVLYDRASDDADWLRRSIAEAMAEAGTEAALPVLEAILYESSEGQNIKKMIWEWNSAPSGESLESMRERLPYLKVKSRGDFLESIAAAVDAIRSRAIKSGTL